jgi:hypothetical protein
VTDLATLTPPDLHHRLHQGTAWLSYGDDGRLHRIDLDQMTDDHRARVTALLRQRAHQLHAAQRAYHLRQIKTGRDVHQHLHDVAVLDRTPPAVWLDETPLMRRLRQLTPDQPPAPRRRRWLPARLLRGRA